MCGLKLCAHICVKSSVMTGRRHSNDRDFTTSCHTTNQTGPGPVSVLLPPLKEDLFNQGSDYNIECPLGAFSFGTSGAIFI